MLLSLEPGVELVGQAHSGPEAIEMIRALRPDLVFLDVNLSIGTGFSVLEELGTDLPRAVIFVTAHDEYALQAFEVNAVDYLLKPFDRARFSTALQRALDRLGSRSSEHLFEKITAMLDRIPPPSEQNPPKIPIKSGARIIFVNLVDIDWVGSADNYVEIHVGAQSHLLRETMASMEKRLPGDTFVRISRTTIVNRERIRELQPLFHGEYSVVLRDGTKLTLSRSYREHLSRLGVH